MPFRLGGTSVALVGLLVFVLVEVLCQFILYGSEWQNFSHSRFWAFFGVALILIILLLWLMVFAGRIERWSQAQVEAKVQALQSRIRPHFLFNSLNSIAELTMTKPQSAEAAITSLSLLFRASLEDIEKSHSLAAEIALCESYLELERWRLADKLTFLQSITVQEPDAWQVPKLILQPLIENAVVHGVQDDGTVKVKLDIKETANYISIMVRNQKGAMANESQGNGMAIENIRERLFVLYDDKQSFKVRQQGDDYQVIMRIPKSRKEIIGR